MTVQSYSLPQWESEIYFSYNYTDIFSKRKNEKNDLKCFFFSYLILFSLTCCVDLFWFISEVIYVGRKKQGFCCVWSVGAEQRAGLTQATWGRIMNQNMRGARQETKTIEGFVVFFGSFPFIRLISAFAFITGCLCCTVQINWTRNVHIKKYASVIRGRWKNGGEKKLYRVSQLKFQWHEVGWV